MMSPDELREHCHGLRANADASTAADLTHRIIADVKEYRTASMSPRAQLPPHPFDELLPLMGWLIYEASLAPLWPIPAGFELLDEATRSEGESNLEVIRRLAHAARLLPWPEFAPRALGAIRSLALAESKRDTEAGYDAAWVAHREASEKWMSFRASLAASDSANRLALDEVFLQLALAETGTACRTAERVIGRWAEGVADGDWAMPDETRWTQRLFRQLTEAVDIGERALATATQIDERFGFVTRVDEHRMALTTAYRNPAIMTARAALLQLALSGEMEAISRRPPGNHQSWLDFQHDLFGRFTGAYRVVKQPVHRDREAVPFPLEHRRSVVQLRLHAALVAPGQLLPSSLTFAPCLAFDRLDDEAVEALSAWLADNKSDANVIGTATMPGFIRSVDACRAMFGVFDDGYRRWRTTWFRLDRYHLEPGRRERIAAVLP